jgi:hypothetical protein
MPLRSQTIAGADVPTLNVTVAGAEGRGVNLAAARDATMSDVATTAGSAAATAPATTTPADGFFNAKSRYLGAVAPVTPAAYAWYRTSWTCWRRERCE